MWEKIKKLYVNSKEFPIIGILLVVVICFTIILNLIPQFIINWVDAINTVVGLGTFLFAILTWAVAHKDQREANNKRVKHEYKEKTNAALFITSGPQPVEKNMLSFLTETGKEEDNSEYIKKIKDIICGEAFEGIPSHKLVLIDNHKALYKHNSYDDHDNIINVYLINTDNNRKNGRVIQIQFDKMPEDEETLRKFLRDYDEILEEVTGILASNGVQYIHLFTKSTLEIPYLVQNHFCNTFIVELYHFVSGNNYVYAGEMVKKDYLG